MRKYCFFICVTTLCCLGCKCKTSTQRVPVTKNEVFAPALRDKLNEFFLSVDFCLGIDENLDEDEDKSEYNNESGEVYVAKYRKHKRLYRLSFHKEGKWNIVLLHTDYFYSKQKIKGYTFIDDRLVVYDGNYTGQAQDLIDMSKLTLFKDSIPGYDSDEIVDLDYEVIMQEHIIHTRDSLILTYFGF